MNHAAFQGGYLEKAAEVDPRLAGALAGGGLGLLTGGVLGKTPSWMLAGGLAGAGLGAGAGQYIHARQAPLRAAQGRADAPVEDTLPREADVERPAPRELLTAPAALKLGVLPTAIAGDVGAKIFEERTASLLQEIQTRRMAHQAIDENLAHLRETLIDPATGKNLEWFPHGRTRVPYNPATHGLPVPPAKKMVDTWPMWLWWRQAEHPVYGPAWNESLVFREQIGSPHDLRPAWEKALRQRNRARAMRMGGGGLLGVGELVDILTSSPTAPETAQALASDPWYVRLPMGALRPGVYTTAAASEFARLLGG